MLNFAFAISILGFGLVVIGGMALRQSRKMPLGLKRSAFVCTAIFAILIGVCIAIGGLVAPAWFGMPADFDFISEQHRVRQVAADSA